MMPRPAPADHAPPRPWVHEPSLLDFAELLHAYLEHLARRDNTDDPLGLSHRVDLDMVRQCIDGDVARVFAEHIRHLPPVHRPYLAAVPDMAEAVTLP